MCVAPLSVRVSPQVEVKALGSAVEFTCSASGGPEITLEWLKEGGTLPHNHHIKDGVLRWAPLACHMHARCFVMHKQPYFHLVSMFILYVLVGEQVADVSHIIYAT